MKISGELEKLKALHAEGTLSDQEFGDAKRRLLAGESAPGRRERTGISTAIWALVVVVLVGAAGAVFFLGQIGENLKVIAGAAALGAGLVGSVMASMEDLGFVAIGGFAVAAIAIALVAFAVIGPIVLVIALPVLAIAAAWTWFGDIFGG